MAATPTAAACPGEWHRTAQTGETRVSAYAMRYQLALYSNFTYALERPTTGDQFSQQDRRSVYGLQASQALDHMGWPGWTRTEAGVQLRHDRIRVGLFDTWQRAPGFPHRAGRSVRETQLGVYLQSACELQPWLRGARACAPTACSSRVDSLSQRRQRRQAPATPRSRPSSAWWPAPGQDRVFFNPVAAAQQRCARHHRAVDPAAVTPVEAVPGLVASRLGDRRCAPKAWPGLQSSLACGSWTSTPSWSTSATPVPPRPAASRRRGVEFNNRWTPCRHVLFDADLAWTHARFDNGDRIPNAGGPVASWP
jgi:hypothetical protein